MEIEYVKNIYEIIAEHFDKTRVYCWKGIKEFILEMNKNSLVLDSGCGNGINMLLRNDCKFIGFDFCEKSMQICKQKKLEILINNIKYIPFRDNLFDYTICIAVLHHLEKDQLIAINEIIRVTKLGGKIFIQVWSNKIEKTKKFIHIKGTEYFITWLTHNNIKYKRYYNLFELETFIELFKKIKNIKKIKINEEHNNYYIILEKI